MVISLAAGSLVLRVWIAGGTIVLCLLATLRRTAVRLRGRLGRFHEPWEIDENFDPRRYNNLQN